jgi:hypothetical protein
MFRHRVIICIFARHRLKPFARMTIRLKECADMELGCVWTKVCCFEVKKSVAQENAKVDLLVLLNQWASMFLLKISATFSSPSLLGVFFYY